MTCPDLDGFVYPYLDGELEAADRRVLEEHLAVCGSCAQRVATEASFQAALRRSVRVQRVPAPEALRAMLHAGIRREHRRVQLVSWARWGGMALVAATASVAWLQLRPPPPDLVTDDAARRFQRRLPLELVHPAPETIETWFDDKLDWRVPVPRLPNAQLAGARMSQVGAHEAAYIAYQAAVARDPGAPQRQMGLFVIDDPERTVSARPWPAVEVSSARGYNVARWRTGDLVYEVVTDLDVDTLRSMIAGARPATPFQPAPARAPMVSGVLRRWPTYDITPVSAH
jgi:anti-sigma factor RsiW